MHGDTSDWIARRGIEWILISIVVLVALSHVVPNSISIGHEISRGKDHGNIACWLIFILIVPLCGLLAYRMHDREYYIFSYPLTWFVPLSLVLMPTHYNDSVHIASAVSLFVLMISMCVFFMVRSDYAHLVKFKVAIIIFACLLGFNGIGITEKVLIIETSVSLYLVNRIV
jgi:hypothetical protein